MAYVKKGDAIQIPVYLDLVTGPDDNPVITPIDIGEVAEVEVVLEKIRHVYPDDMHYDAEENAVLFPLTQEETFAICGIKTIPMDVRVAFVNGAVRGIPEYIRINLADALSDAILGEEAGG